MKFWDSSAVVPLLFDEPKSGPMLELVESDGELIVWWATAVECASAIARREREGELDADDSTVALGRLNALERGWTEIIPSEGIRRLARRLLRVHALRTADSLQLAAALLAADHDPTTLSLVSLEHRLVTAARKEGFEVVG